MTYWCVTPQRASGFQATHHFPDGSSNVEAGIPTGTIVGIYEYDDSCVIDDECLIEAAEQEDLCLACTLQPGDNLVAAAYCLYSSATPLVMTIGNGSYGFVLDKNLGEFVLTNPSIEIPKSANYMSFNEARSWGWEKPVRKVLAEWKSKSSATAEALESRYIGSMVADV